MDEERRGRPGTYAAALLLAAILAGVVVVRLLLPEERPDRDPALGGGSSLPAATTLVAGSGVHGTVVLRQGNCQPRVVGRTGGLGCELRPTSRRLYVYSPPIGGSEIEGAYYRGGRRPASVGRSDGQGGYAIALPAGAYSILVEDRGRSYCRSFSGGLACAVTVRAGERVRRDLEIDHGSS
jgi:hypothetical protein